MLLFFALLPVLLHAQSAFIPYRPLWSYRTANPGKPSTLNFEDYNYIVTPIMDTVLSVGFTGHSNWIVSITFHNPTTLYTRTVRGLNLFEGYQVQATDYSSFNASTTLTFEFEPRDHPVKLPYIIRRTILPANWTGLYVGGWTHFQLDTAADNEYVTSHRISWGPGDWGTLHCNWESQVSNKQDIPARVESFYSPMSFTVGIDTDRIQQYPAWDDIKTQPEGSYKLQCDKTVHLTQFPEVSFTFDWHYDLKRVYFTGYFSFKGKDNFGRMTTKGLINLQTFDQLVFAGNLLDPGVCQVNQSECATRTSKGCGWDTTKNRCVRTDDVFCKANNLDEFMFYGTEGYAVRTIEPLWTEYGEKPYRHVTFSCSSNMDFNLTGYERGVSITRVLPPMAVERFDVTMCLGDEKVRKILPLSVVDTGATDVPNMLPPPQHTHYYPSEPFSKYPSYEIGSTYVTPKLSPWVRPIKLYPYDSPCNVIAIISNHNVSTVTNVRISWPMPAWPLPVPLGSPFCLHGAFRESGHKMTLAVQYTIGNESYSGCMLECDADPTISPVQYDLQFDGRKCYCKSRKLLYPTVQMSYVLVDPTAFVPSVVDALPLVHTGGEDAYAVPEDKQTWKSLPLQITKGATFVAADAPLVVVNVGAIPVYIPARVINITQYGQPRNLVVPTFFDTATTNNALSGVVQLDQSLLQPLQWNYTGFWNFQNIQGLEYSIHTQCPWSNVGITNSFTAACSMLDYDTLVSCTLSVADIYRSVNSAIESTRIYPVSTSVAAGTRPNGISNRKVEEMPYYDNDGMNDNANDDDMEYGDYACQIKMIGKGIFKVADQSGSSKFITPKALCDQPVVRFEVPEDTPQIYDAAMPPPDDSFDTMWLPIVLGPVVGVVIVLATVLMIVIARKHSNAARITGKEEDQAVEKEDKEQPQKQETTVAKENLGKEGNVNKDQFPVAATVDKTLPQQ